MRGALAVVDVGTSAVRAAVLSTTGDVRAATARRVSARRGGDGTAALDPRALWAAVGDAVREVVADERVTGLGLAAQLGVALLDELGEPVLPPMTWEDRRGGELLEDLPPGVGELVRSLSGRRPSPELLAAKLLWLREKQPEAARRMRWAVSLKDHLLHRLTGRVVTDQTHASYTMLYDVARRCWSPELASAFDVDLDLLPSVQQATTPLALSPAAAATLGLPPGLPVAVGGPDGTVGALGAGAVSAGSTVDIAGSTDVLVHVADRAVVDDTGAAVLNAHAVPDRWSLGGPTGLTGGGLQHLLAATGQPDVVAAHAELADAAAALPAGSEGLTVLTTLGGGRFPHWRPAMTGGLIGLREDHSTAHLVRAAHEGAAFLVLDGIEAIERLGHAVEEVVVVGGVATGRTWLQIRADAWQRPVLRLGQREATSVGAAMLAGVACGAFPDLQTAAAQMVRHRDRLEPVDEVATPMFHARRRWQQLLSLVDATTTMATPAGPHRETSSR
jgi:xylulokinase